MNLEEFTLKELLEAAIKSEIESRKVYGNLAKRVKNALLKERLELLAKEEEKHENALRKIFSMNFGDEKPQMPEKIRVPLPEVNISSENDPISLVLESAMEAEKASEEFYRSLAERFEGDVYNMLIVLSEMEHTHYLIIETEYKNMKRFEDYDSIWPMMHVGP